MKRELVLFVLIGSVGFCIDGGLLLLLINLNWDPLEARLISFPTAATCTWLLNRGLTFKNKKTHAAHAEYIYYVSSQIVGAAINFTVFVVMIYAYPSMAKTPLIPLATGAMISLVFNYYTSKRLIFKGAK